jgi:hypothetical protein
MSSLSFRTVFAAACLVAATAAIALGVSAPFTSASGHGTLLVTEPDGKQARRQFSFNAQQGDGGTATGNAILHNPEFTGQDDKKYMLQVDISCMNVFDNTVVFGGTTRRTNDPNLVDAVYFSVQDNGEPGAGNDKISQVYFFDADPTTTGDPMACLQLGPTDLPMDPIEAGNISVR